MLKLISRLTLKTNHISLVNAIFMLMAFKGFHLAKCSVPNMEHNHHNMEISQQCKGRLYTFLSLL